VNIKLAQESDKNDWDKYVSAHESGTPYHKWAWLNSITAAYGFKTVGWLVTNEQGEVLGVLPMAKISIPLLSSKLTALPYCDAGGVLANSIEVKNQLLDKAITFANDNKITTIEHRQTKVLDQAEELSQESKVRMLLALPESSEELLASFKSKLRSQIRKAEKNGLTASTGNDQQHLDGFYQVYTRNMRDLGSPAHSKRWFESVISTFGGEAIIANVYKDDVVVGAGIVLFNGERCSIPWASTVADYNRLAPNMLLYWSLLAYSTDSGCKEFDFGRSTPGEGTYKFKAQWGAKPSGLDWQVFKDGHLITEAPSEGSDNKPGHTSKLRSSLELVWQKLPVSLATFIGSNLRKYITL